MSGWDSERVTSVDLRLGLYDGRHDEEQEDCLLTKSEAQLAFSKFIREFRSESGSSFPYRDKLRASYEQAMSVINGTSSSSSSSSASSLSSAAQQTSNSFNCSLEIDCTHLRDFNGKLLSVLRTAPAEYIPLFEESARITAVQLTTLHQEPTSEHPDVQIHLLSFERSVAIRALSAVDVSRLVSVSGIVVSASRPRIKATRLAIMCRQCKSVKHMLCEGGFGGVKLPRTCDTVTSGANRDPNTPKCPLDPFIILADSSLYIDQQRLKLQENTDDIPTGELPRTLSVSLERTLVGTAKPGSRITLTGMFTTYEAATQGETKRAMGGQSEQGVRIPYLRAFGLTVHNGDIEEMSLLSSSMSTSDVAALEALGRDPSIRERIQASIAPAIFDNDETLNIKAALACQLFGGSRKALPDGMRLRGDINVLLLGDPSVAKSQFLKFMIQLAPIGVYTSGKGSSAAGLTASVIRDPSSGDFHLEGGALVLADGGLVCIDEFDKMRDQDRVAIHEAMEQQTISIAKAGITTILNSRTAVLAAANPIFGRYDDTRSPSENIDFQTSILSRFDLIFIVRDIQDRARDTQLAKHVISVHRGLDAGVEAMRASQGTALLDTQLLKKYVAYAKHHVHPRLSEAAASELQAQYVHMRTQLAASRAEHESQHSGSSAGNVIPITVRQLEAIIRLSESFARMELRGEATMDDVRRALELFNVSTFRAATASYGGGGGSSSSARSDGYGGVGPASAAFDSQVKAAEVAVQQRVAIGTKISLFALKQTLKERPNLTEPAIEKAIWNLIKSEAFYAFNQGRMVCRRR